MSCIDIATVQIKSGYLNDHVFYPEFESLVIVFVCIIVSVMFSELSQCLLPAQWGADAAKSDVSFYTILFASGYATYDGFDAMRCDAMRCDAMRCDAI